MTRTGWQRFHERHSTAFGGHKIFFRPAFGFDGIGTIHLRSDRDGLRAIEDAKSTQSQTIILAIPTSQTRHRETHITGRDCWELEPARVGARVGKIPARIIHDGLRILEISIVRRLDLESQREHCRAEIAVLAWRTRGDDIQSIQPFARTEIELDPFDGIGTRGQLAAVTMNRRQRTIGRIGKDGIADPLRRPIGRLQQPHAPRSRLTPIGRFARVIPGLDFPKALLLCGQSLAGISNVRASLGNHLAAVPKIARVCFEFIQ